MKTLDGYDVVVVGAGPGGFGAAVAAARDGARTLLIEREGFLGGAATVMLVNPYNLSRTKQGDDQPVREINAGVYGELSDRLLESGAGRRFREPDGGIKFDDEMLKVILDDMAADAGVDVLYHAALYDAEIEDGRVTAVLSAHNAGPLRVPAKVFIDGTGDGLLAERAGAEVMVGNEEGQVMPMTTFMVIGGADLDRIPPLSDMYGLCGRGAEDTPALQNTNFSFMQISPTGLVYINAIRIPGDPLDPMDLSRAETKGRKLAENFVAWMKANLPGYENAYLAKTPSHIGIRETRRVVGDYLLTADDYRKRALFDDGIACCAYGIDIHKNQAGSTNIEHFGPGEYYQIPYRCLTPKGLQNLLIASRCISADVAAHSSIRIMPPVMNIGEAAGHAAAMVLPEGDTRSVDIEALRDRIRESGGVIEPWVVA